MRPRAIAALCALAVGCGGGPTLKVYYRTSPRRVATTKTTSPSALSAIATRQGPRSIDVHVKRVSAVSIHRVLHYNSSVMVYLPSGSPGNELMEVFIGVLSPMAPFVWGLGTHDGSQTATRKVVRLKGPMRALLDPSVSVWGNDVRDVPVVEEQVFSDEPVVREYDIRLPSSTVRVAYRVLDVMQREVARGTALTSRYGELRIEGDLEAAVAVELTINDAAIVIPVQAPTASAAPAVARPPVTSSGVRRPLANAGWAQWSDGSHLLPRINVMLDLGSLTGGNLVLLGELRLARRWSVGVSVAEESIVDRLPPSDGETRIRQLGVLSRLYVLGDVGTGIHIGLEGMVGVNSRLELTSYTPTLGGKYTLDCGVSMELTYGLRHLSVSDPDEPEPLISDWRRRAYLNAGWSF